MTFDEAIEPDTIAISLRDSTGSAVVGGIDYDATEMVATLTPGSPLVAGGTYTVTVEAAEDLDGNSLQAPVAWSFSVVAATFVSLWTASTVPGTTLVNDPGSVNVGMKFRAMVDGAVHGVRFFKGGPSNSGPHTGVLWEADGNQLASVTLGGETARGWQLGMFAVPVAVTAGTMYVVSYLAPNGYYAADGGFFSGGGFTNGPLEALQNGAEGGNGVYVYSSDVAFPTSSYNGANYWVDVLFLPESEA
ncbi:hypothetical protein GCM10009583_31570 [Ornithinicoccus hortensis]